MSRPKKDPVIAAKERKQKIVLGVLSVVFLILLALEGPGTLRRLKGAAPPPPPASTTTTPTATPSTPAATTPAAPAATTTSTSTDAGLVQDPPGPPAPREGQLVSFSLFSVRDPFASPSPAGKAKPPAGAGTTTTTTPKKKKTTAPGTGTGQTPTVQAPVPLPPVVPPAQTGSSPTQTGPSPTTTRPQLPAVPTPTAATISVNGVKESVDVNGLFPSSSQIFQLRSVDSASATIAVAGGAFASGEATLTLQLGQPVTLMNTADGTRYELLLVSVP